MVELEFQDHYVLAVLALLWLLCFCRTILDSCGSCLQLANGCIEANVCFSKSCVECYQSSRFGEFLRQVVVIFCFMQPAMYCGIYLYNKSRPLPPASSVVLHNVQLNISGLVYRHGNASHALQAQVRHWNLVEIDFLLLVMLFAVLVCVSSVLWMHCINMRDFTEQTTWDTQMPESVMLYEVAYYVELWAMNFAFVAAASSERSLLEVHYAAMALSAMLVFSVSQAKHETELSVVQHTFSLLVMLCFFCVLVPLWFEMVQTACFAALAMAVTHACVLFVLAGFHSIARGSLLASHVLLVRIACSVCACAAHIAVYASGRNEHC